MEENIVKGSLHSHGCWTDYRNPNETKKFPFNLEKFSEYCISCGRDFQAMADVMANWPGKPEFIEHRYQALLETANPSTRNYELQTGNRESVIYFKSGEKLVIPRSQEILTDTHYKHILAVGTNKDIRGGRPTIDTLKDIRDSAGYIVIDHPFMCYAWTEEELIKLFEKSLIHALEWNGGLTFPAWLPRFVRKKTPNKESNIHVLSLESKIPVIGNDDSHSAKDIERGTFTEYYIKDTKKELTDIVFDSIGKREYKRYERHSSLFAPIKHLLYGKQSQKKFGEFGLPNP